MDGNTKITATQDAGFSGTDAPQAFREMAEKGTTQAKETYEKMNAVTTDDRRCELFRFRPQAPGQ
jgi:hypothetical protein